MAAGELHSLARLSGLPACDHLYVGAAHAQTQSPKQSSYKLHVCLVFAMAPAGVPIGVVMRSNHPETLLLLVDHPAACQCCGWTAGLTKLVPLL